MDPCWFDRGKVIDFVYMNSDRPQSKTLPEVVVMQFSHLELYMSDFLEDYPGTVAIPNITAEWTEYSFNGVFTRTQFPLNLNWAFTIQTVKGKNRNV